MRPLAYTFPYALVFWTTFLWAYLPEFALINRSIQRAGSATTTDAGSTRTLLLGTGLAFAVAFQLARKPSLQWSPPVEHFTFFAGLALLIAGSLLRRHCRRVLHQYFTAHIAAQATQPVISSGAYAWVRHPSYTGGILMNTSVGIAVGSWASTAMLLVTSVVLYGYRIKVEERALLATIGEPYRVFIATRKRLIPYVY
jgi:protein-S-isoprenylcysteine O-methyltransferase Ste14